jgi:hypothetical protein
MRKALCSAFCLLLTATASADPLNCRLPADKPPAGLTAAVAADVLTLSWEADQGQEVRLRLVIDNGTPTIRELAIRKRGGQWGVLAANAKPEFRLVSGLRRMTNQQMVPLREHGVRITDQIINDKKWDAFWDAPLDLTPPAARGGRGGAGAPAGGRGGAAPAPTGPPVTDFADPAFRGGGNPPPAPGVASQPGLPRKPEEIRRATATYRATGCDAKIDGNRLEVSFPGMTLGVFAGRLQFTVYKGTSLIRMESIAKTEEPSVAYKYDAGLAGLALDGSTRMVWRDLSNLWQESHLGGKPNEAPVGLKTNNRLLIAEKASGAIAAFPPPHTFFWTREVETNLGYSWYRKDSESTFAFGIQQPEREEEERYFANFALYSAPPGSWQRMAAYFVVSSEPAAATFDRAMAFTRGDRYKALPGYQVMASHFHMDLGRRLREAGSLDVRLPDLDALKATGVNIVSPTDRPNGPDRLDVLYDYYEAARRHSDKNFLVMPNEEASGILGGHWDVLISKPLFWVRQRPEGKPLVENHPKYGKVYWTDNEADIMEMMRRENALIFMPHPRTKGSTGYPDAIKDTPHFRDEHYRGVGWRWGMGLDLSERRLSDYRVLPLLDDMNNWLADTTLPLKYIHAITETYEKKPGDDIYANNPVSYIKLDKLPQVDDMSPVINAIKRGDFFVTSGEVLISSWAVQGAGRQRTVTADVEWTFPLEFVEVVWGDGKKTDRQIVPATHLPAMGKHRFEIPFDPTGKKWVRFAVWDSAGNGAAVQPVRVTAAQTTTAQ